LLCSGPRTNPWVQEATPIASSRMVLVVEGYMGAVGKSGGAEYEEPINITDGAPEVIFHAPADARLL
jgi:hypothetical protein